MAKKTRLRVVLCRGCCCGTPNAEAPGFDHRAQLRAIKGAIANNPDAELKMVSCLNHCSRANIVVLSGARALRRPTWLGDMVEPQANKELCAWIASGAQDDLPDTVAAHQMDPREPEYSTRHDTAR
jgi:predicted metal-binding protein